MLRSIFNAKYGKFLLIDAAGMQALQRYAWPGNVRELQNIVERIVIISDPAAIVSGARISGMLDIEPFPVDDSDENVGLYEIIEATERRMIEKALQIGGSTRRAAALLKIDQSTIVKKAKKYGILTK